MTTATIQPPMTDSTSAPTTAAATKAKRKRGRPLAGLQDHARRRAHLKVFALCGNLKRAAEVCRISPSLHRRWMKSPDYAAAFERAKEAFIRRIEDECIRRAVHGTRRYLAGPDGKPEIDPDTGRPAYRLEFSDALLVRLMLAWCPHYFSADACNSGILTNAEQERVRWFSVRFPKLIERHRRKLAEVLATGNPLAGIPFPPSADRTSTADLAENDKTK